jgi:predicted molibdopterin-dependent oxidoreductase YjgC
MLDRLEGPDPPKVIVIDPRLSNTAKKATVHLAPRIGTNMAVLNGIQHLLFENGWVNDEYVAKHVIGVEELRKKVKPYNPTYVEEVTGIPESKLRNAAEIIGNTPSMLSTALQGVYQSNQATASACQINNINLLRGLIGRPGSGIYQMNGQPTAQNNREAGCDGEYPGFRNFQNPQQMQEIADIWNIDFHKTPHWNEPTHIESMLNYIDGGTIELFWISGTNPLVSLPNLPRVREVLTKKELFVVCQDIFPTETTAIADVVLPAAQWGEKTGCFTNVDRTVHLSNKAIDPPGEAKSDLDIFLDYSKRMDFRDKDGSPLTPWTESSQVFEAWKKMSKGRPCDYSEMTYKKLIGGSGIQWPCTEKYPHGRERLFEDGVFFTDVDYCESFGHDLETGAPLTLDQYRAMNPAGRAILKSADYLPALDAPDKEYPLQLSTGRRVYHFHTRTKTGRSKELQAAAPGPMIEVSAEDAAAANVEDGEDVVVRSRRGIVEMPIRISKIAKGQTFIPFHYGYFDAPDSRARAANELTQEQWDPISKQPMFKSGAIRIEKLTPSPSGTVKIHAREKQTTAIDKVTRAKPQAHDISDPSAHSRERHLEFWLGATYEAINVLIEICSRLIPQYIHQDEVHAGVKVMRRITESMAKKLKPLACKYGEKNEYGLGVSTTLRDNLFPDYKHERAPNTYEVLVGLQALYMYNAHVQSHLIALTPASQALWDSDFMEAVSFCTTQIDRQQAWVKQQIKVRGPQTLLVPTTPLSKGFVLRERTGSAQDPIHAFRDGEVKAEDLPFGEEPK